MIEQANIAIERMSERERRLREMKYARRNKMRYIDKLLNELEMLNLADQREMPRGLSVAVDLVCATLMWSYESGLKGSDIHGFGDAVFFSTVQILTVSSSLKNPVTAAGQAVDVALEFWAVFVITAVAGSFASFFHSGDTQ